jgi:threonine dehydrogenase-like Zn-dependent dehydrogenase
MVVLGKGPTAAILGVLGRSRGVTVVSTHGENAADQVREELRSVDASGRPQKIFVCDGDQSLPAAMEIANPGSVVVVAQAGGSLDLTGLAARDLTLLGFSYGHPDLMTETAALVAKGELDLSPFMHHQVMSADAARQSELAFGEGQCLVLTHA